MAENQPDKPGSLPAGMTLVLGAVGLLVAVLVIQAIVGTVFTLVKIGLVIAIVLAILSFITNAKTKR